MLELSARASRIEAVMEAPNEENCNYSFEIFSKRGLKHPSHPHDCKCYYAGSEDGTHCCGNAVERYMEKCKDCTEYCSFVKAMMEVIGE